MPLDKIDPFCIISIHQLWVSYNQKGQTRTVEARIHGIHITDLMQPHGPDFETLITYDEVLIDPETNQSHLSGKIPDKTADLVDVHYSRSIVDNYIQQSTIVAFNRLYGCLHPATFLALGTFFSFQKTEAPKPATANQPKNGFQKFEVSLQCLSLSLVSHGSRFALVTCEKGKLVLGLEKDASTTVLIAFTLLLMFLGRKSWLSYYYRLGKFDDHIKL